VPQLFDFAAARRGASPQSASADSTIPDMLGPARCS
jgi:hypothetical protein